MYVPLYVAVCFPNFWLNPNCSHCGRQMVYPIIINWSMVTGGKYSQIQHLLLCKTKPQSFRENRIFQIKSTYGWKWQIQFIYLFLHPIETPLKKQERDFFLKTEIHRDIKGHRRNNRNKTLEAGKRWTHGNWSSRSEKANS